MPQLLVLIIAGAGLLFARRWYNKEQARIVTELRRTQELMEQRKRERERIVPLERDPATGVYRPKQR